jgi:hypothetical protein
MNQNFSSVSLSTGHAVRMTAAAAALLYMLFLIGGEASHSFAANDAETVIVQLTVDSGIGFSCDANGNGSRGSGETLSIGTITFTGDTGVYSDNRAVKCRVVTNNVTGYTVGWRVHTGSGGTTTGHLISQFEDIIQAFGTGSTFNYTKAWELNPSSNQNDSRWGGRVSSTSSGSDVAPMLWGTDASSEKWARVKTGSTLTIRQSSTVSQSGSGDLIKIGFRAAIGSLKAQETGTYQTTVTFTAATQ